MEDWNSLTPELKEKALKAVSYINGPDDTVESTLDDVNDVIPWLDEKGRINEVAFAAVFLAINPMRCIGGRLFTVDGMVSDEKYITNEIFGMVSRYVTSNVAKKVEQIMNAIKLAAYSCPLDIQTDRIHVFNGTYFLDGEFSHEKEFCLNRLKVSYDPQAPLPTNRFAVADLEYKLVMVDDDMKTEALPDTHVLKSLVTLEDKMDIERKGRQSEQGTMYVRLMCFGNGTLQALYDKSDGFYRRQIILVTKDKPKDRIDDPFLIDRLRNETAGIFLWALEGLERLILNNLQFTISERAKKNLEAAKENGNNLISFIKSGKLSFETGAKTKSTVLYEAYTEWCRGELEKPYAAKTFIHFFKEHQKELGIVYDDRCVGRSRGFHNVCINEWIDADVPDIPFS